MGIIQAKLLKQVDVAAEMYDSAAKKKIKKQIASGSYKGNAVGNLRTNE